MIFRFLNLEVTFMLDNIKLILFYKKDFSLRNPKDDSSMNAGHNTWTMEWWARDNFIFYILHEELTLYSFVAIASCTTSYF